MKNNYFSKNNFDLSNGYSNFEMVIKEGLCVGCGICSGIFPESFKMEISKYGEYHPIFLNNYNLNQIFSKAEKFCPFTGVGENEDRLGQEEFGNLAGINHLSELGYFLNTYVGWVTNDSNRISSSAGGLTTWLLKYLLKNKIIDGVICVNPTNSNDIFFEYSIIRKEQDLDKSKKSKYYTIELSKVIKELKASDGKYAIVALPCFIKGLRLAIQHGFLPRERFYCMIGLFCGHLKTTQFSHYLIRQCGLKKTSVITVDFRKKLLNEKASDYAFEVTAKNEFNNVEKHHIKMKDVLLGNWGLNAFMLKACEYCDDVVAELADVSLGDAWLPEYVTDSRGTNIIICRRNDLHDIFLQAADTGEIALEDIDPKNVILSQDGGFRQRRQALSYRLFISRKYGLWRPKKRISPSSKSIKIFSKIIQKIRIKIAQSSKEKFHEYLIKNDLKSFSNQMSFWVYIFNFLYKTKRLFKLITSSFHL
ncbi:MAG: Coenzyme F420 hydrogenase/dehydrogenase, beta subunit C-terminal domain [Proteobacteria bacterium]|nr:Coenzyme F420 hydrogenase/dehydrogenase, beta subunit C-terminal domain [Pseudomonadota bacterium]